MTVPPGVLVVAPSLLVSVRPGVVITGVVSLALALVLPSLTLALLAIWLTPAGSDVSTVTAKVALLLAPPARLPIFKVQAAPIQVQLPELAAALKLVLAGTVSCRARP